MKWIFPILFIFSVTACGGGGRAVAPVGVYDSSTRKVAPAPNTYSVQRGDTLYSISWRYGMDYRELARINGIRSPYTIYVGQKLKFSGRPATTAPTRTVSRPATTVTKPITPAKPIVSPSTTSRPTPAPPKPTVKPSPPPVASKPSVASKPEPFSGTQNLSWRWPTSGNVVSSYSASSTGRKGIDIAGQAGQAIVAAASGKVVYSGNGMPRYGNLLIIKHNDVYLSAYAHNQTLLVKEGDVVQAGQKIALMGRTGTQRNQLHFEIRRNGKPVDPTSLLPKR